MAKKDLKKNSEKLDTNNVSEETNITVSEDTSDALNSFLESETSDKRDKKPKKGISKNKLNFLLVAIAALVIVIIVALIFLFNSMEDETNTIGEVDEGTPITLSVDDKGEHQATLILNEDGELDNNSYGTLIDYTPSEIKQMDVENESGTYTILSETPVTIDEETGEELTDTTIYTLVGYEDMQLQSGGPDTIANDVAAVDFLSVADISGENAKDFGFDSPRATVKTQYTDGSYSTIIVGSDAPKDLGTYIMFGESKTIYLATVDSVDGLLFSIADLMTLTINDSATSTDNSIFKSLTLSGTAFDKEIEIKPNKDEAIESSYVMVKPQQMFISEVEAASISGAIRGLYADKAVCVNPSDKQLKKYGLATPYATLTAVYPDTTVHLTASKPDDGKVYIIADSDIIYETTEEKLPWVKTSLDKLRPDVVISPNFNSLSKIVFTDKSGSHTFNMSTKAVDDGTTTYTNIIATYKGEELDSDNYYVFFQNISNIQNSGTATSDPSGKPAITIELSYSTGRATDVVKIYPSDSAKYTATLNGETLCLVNKTYCTKLSDCLQSLIKGETVDSL